MRRLGSSRGKERAMRCGLRRWLVALGVGALTVLTAAATVNADVQSDQTGAILVFPKVLVDTTNGIDTLIRINNASDTPITLECFYIDATPHCDSDSSLNCITDERFADLPQCPNKVVSCSAQWQETDFRIVLTKNQPFAWLASQGAVSCQSLGMTGQDSDPNNNVPCFELDGTFRVGENGQSNIGGRIPLVGEDPFEGELKCVAVDSSDTPVDRNDVYGNATITESVSGKIDTSTYNAIGIQALPTLNGDSTLVLGRPGDPGVEYNGCPNLLILDHFFDFATDPVSGEPVTTNISLVPCTEDIANQSPTTTPVQFLVFNEFEQRFSTSKSVTCYRDIQISNLDTNTNDRSIFSAQVAGTLTGQTRSRGVSDTVLGIAEEYRAGGTAAINMHFQGIRPQNDFIYLPPPP
jgi:hypothetical protein